MKSNKYNKAFVIPILLLFLAMMQQCLCDSSGGGRNDTLPSSGKDITSFIFEAGNNPGLSRDLTCDIIGTNITATAFYGTDLSGLIASFTTTGISVTVDGVAQVSGQTPNDFTGNLVYTVTAEDGSGRDYAVSIEAGAWVQDAYIKASNADESDHFGTSVAVSGDIIVVGAVFEDSGRTTITNDDGNASTDNSADASGAAYVFKKDATGDWRQDAYLKASNADIDDWFGVSVAVSGETIVVGTGYEDSDQTWITNIDGSASSDNSTIDSGAAYVFTIK